MTFYSDFGRSFLAKVHVDASAATSICERSGPDRVRHLDVNHLWLLEQQARERAPLVTINGKRHLAYLLAKHVRFPELEMHLTRLGIEFRGGRTEKVAKL